MSSAAETVAIEFFAEWGKSWDALSRSFPTWIADDITLLQSGIPDIHSLDNAIVLLNSVHDPVGVEKIEAIVTHVASKDDVVFMERIDHFRRADDSILLAAELTAVLRVNYEGKITWWREYFDPRELLEVMGG